MTIIRPTLVLVSLLAGMYSFVAWVGRLESDAYVAAVVGVLAAGGVLLIDYLESERDRRLRDERERVWSRRDRQAGLS